MDLLDLVGKKIDLNNNINKPPLVFTFIPVFSENRIREIFEEFTRRIWVESSKNFFIH